MKKHLLIAAGLIIGSSLTAQVSFSDDFESYTAGDYIGVVSPTWTTWSGATGGAEDVQVGTLQASSGANSIYFSSTAGTGGPQDVVLPFGGAYDNGMFDISMDVYVASGKNAYFNLQAEATIGTTWALDVDFEAGGDLVVRSGTDGTYITEPYTQAAWHTFMITVNLSTNCWEAYLDGSSIGTFSNSNNKVASLDIFPIQDSDFFVDDVSFNYTPYILPTTNAAPAGTSMNGTFAGANVFPTVNVKNLGTAAITSFDVDIDYNGSTYTENVTGLSLASLGTEVVTFTTLVPLVAGSNPVVTTVSNVNGGGADDNPADDIGCGYSVDPVIPAAGKLVIGEEGTGTWCGWCPRGTVAMEEMANKYDGYWQGIAVHNGDPMVVTDYDSGIGALISGYPSGLVDRGPDIDPSVFEGDFLQRILVAPKATMVTGAAYNATTGVLNVSLTVDWVSAASGAYKIGCVLVEDGVTGGSGYEQSNYYSSTSNNLPLVGAGLDWQASANPVPAALMTYDHVARAICPDFTGHAGFPGTMAASDQQVFNFEFTLDASWDDTKMHIVGMLIEPTGTIDNGSTSNIADAVATGFTAGDVVCGTSSSIDGISSITALEMFPNPANNKVTLKVGLEEVNDVNVTIVDISGKVIHTVSYDQLEGTHFLELDVTDFAAGMYVVNIQAGVFVTSKSLIVE
jgi:hypothetical protein